MADDAARVAVLTASTSRFHGGGPDQSGEELRAFVERLGGEVVDRRLLADDREEIEACLREWSAGGRCDLILTTGGTGFSPDDVTPEATAAVIDRPAPGLAEAMRGASAEHTHYWMVSRGVAGVAGSTLIVNFPGNPRSIGEAGEAIAHVLPHVVSLLRGERPGHSQ